jgi:hypothetical protein
VGAQGVEGSAKEADPYRKTLHSDRLCYTTPPSPQTTQSVSSPSAETSAGQIVSRNALPIAFDKSLNKLTGEQKERVRMKMRTDKGTMKYNR